MERMLTQPFTNILIKLNTYNSFNHSNKMQSKMLKHLTLLILILLKANAEQYPEERTTRRLNEKKQFLNADRRKWDIKPLKDIDFETIKDKVILNKEDIKVLHLKEVSRRKKLTLDAAAITFVSADALPVDENDLINYQSLKNVTHKKIKSRKNKRKNFDINPKTVDSLKATPNPYVKDAKPTSDTRRGEYMFSSDEYYDETVDFDLPICPDAVEVITLELEQLRSYDVECESIVSWLSLRD